jgi:hypothetical protein
MFFKKTEIKKNRDCKIHFKNKGTNNRAFVRRNTTKNPFSIKVKPIKPLRGSRNSRAEKVKKMKRRNSIFGMILFFSLIAIAIFSGYTIINFITGIRGGTSVDDVFYEQKYVEGIESVPIYPNSEFVYKDRKDEEIVMRMINQGLSVYRLPRNTKTSDVYGYYEENLPKTDWEHLSTIPLSTDEKLLGQYWFKDEKGLRIYVENSDVWYELITKNEAENALIERRMAEIQRKRILETSSEQSLLPDYPWVLSVPREYLTRYSLTDIGELQSVEIFEIAGESSFMIYPIGKSGLDSYNQMIHEFFEKQSEKLEENWNILSTAQDFQKEREVLVFKHTIEGKEGDGIVLMNKRNFMVYAIISNEKDHPFFEEIVKEIYEP